MSRVRMAIRGGGIVGVENTMGGWSLGLASVDLSSPEQ